MANILVSKLGIKYETVYYYKQKSVNWEFLSSDSYECLLTVPEAVQTGITEAPLSIALVDIHNILDINVIPYFDDEGYANNIFKYDITVQNITNPITTIIFKSIHNTNKDINGQNVGRAIFKSLHNDTVYNVGTLTFNNAQVHYPLIDTIVCDIEVPIKYTQQIKTQQEQVNINSICFANKIKPFEYDTSNHTFMQFSLAEYRSVLNSPPSSETMLDSFNTTTTRSFPVFTLESAGISTGLVVTNGQDNIVMDVIETKLYPISVHDIGLIETAII